MCDHRDRCEAEQCQPFCANRSAPFGVSLLSYSLEGTEPAHIDAEHGGKVAKFWLAPALPNLVVSARMS
jgi:hypothetical protein